MKNPWIKIRSNSIYEDKWIKVYHDDVIGPNKKKGSYSYVKTKCGVGIVAVNNEGELCLVGQYRYIPNMYSLEIPKGGFYSFNSDESPLQAAKRELKEETGISAEDWVELGSVHTLTGHSNDTVHLFLATKLSYGVSSPDENECINVFYIKFDKIDNVIREGLLIDGKKEMITDATSIAAIHFAKNLIKEYTT